MKILLTGANGYIGTRLLLLLLHEGHEVAACVRSPYRFRIPEGFEDKIQIYAADLKDANSLDCLPKDIDVAFYLVHSMAHKNQNFMKEELLCAKNFVKALKKTKAKQIIYLGGISNAEKLSPHLQSRKNVENELMKCGIPYTILKAGIIFGSGSASFEIIRDLVEKLPIMIAPKWVSTLSQPIAIFDVLFYLTHAIGNEKCYNKIFDIGGPDKMSYKDMLYRFAKHRRLKRTIFVVPVLTPRLSSYWLYFVTSTNFYLAQALVDSLKCEAVCSENQIAEAIPHKCLSFDEAVERAFDKIEQNAVISSWKDSMSGSALTPDLTQYMQIPKHGCLTDVEQVSFGCPRENIVEAVWNIGGKKGWHYMNWAWSLRGFIDQLFGGVGLRRGRTNPVKIRRGDSLDFWRVLVADRDEGRLLLYAEMKLPGEAWLEFKVGEKELTQTATFRPKGLLGRLYWYVLLPFHRLIFKGMARNIANPK